MSALYRSLLLLAALLGLLLPLGAASDSGQGVRVTGTIQATHFFTVQVPRMAGQPGNLTLVTLIPNGSKVHAGDLLAQFDDTAQVKAEREAQAKYDDLTHQVEQKKAEHDSNAEKRRSDLESAQADLQKAEIELRKGPILSDIDKQKNVLEAQDAREHVASLHKSSKDHDIAELAEIRDLELQRDRQKVAMERQRSNAQKLSLRAPISGMVALQNVFRNNSLGHAEEGDQLWPGSALLRIFDPSNMQVALSVDEADGAALTAGTRATVHIDAFPDLILPAHFDSMSPVASSALGNPVKTFTAIFILDKTDPRLVPDLSAAVEVHKAQ